MKKTGWILSALILLVLCSGCGDRLIKVRDLRRDGITMMQEGNYTGAAEQFRHAMAYYGTARQDGTELDILRYLAEAEMLSGDYASAAESYQKLMDSDERKPEYLNLRAVCLVRSGGSLEDALALYNEATEKGDRSEAHLQALYSLGEGMAASGNEELQGQVLSLYEQAVNEGGQTAGLCLHLGKFYFESGDHAWAKEVFLQGESLAEQEMAKEEITEEEMAAVSATLRDLRFNEAVCLEYEGDYSGALELFEAVRAEYGEAEDLTHEITFLKTRN